MAIVSCAVTGMALSTAAAIVVSIEPSSTSTQLDLVITGTVAASDYGSNFFNDPFPRLYIYKDTLEWTGATLSNSHQNPFDGASLNAPSIEIADFRTQIATNSPFAGTPQDFVVLEWAPNDGGIAATDFAIGKTLDYSLSLRNFSLPVINFDAFRTSSIPISAQLGSGPVPAVPEPATVALLFGVCGFGFALTKRHRLRHL
jgi:hypothetical protein